eukprot:jgi/Mesen1/6296/ME000325S05437
MEQLKTFGRELAMGTQAGWGSSKEFLDLVKAIGEAKSKAEEDRIMTAEIENLKRKIAEPDVPKKKMKEYIIRLVYVEMLGHDASFGYIHAVKMTHDDNLLLKKTGYLAVTLFLDDNHDLIILIVNTIQKDLKSDNHLIVCAALGAVCKLINEETIPAVLPQVVDLLTHPKEVVRKKAVMALHRFYQRAPSTISHIIPRFRQVLCDKDPSVMTASLCALYELIATDAAPYKNLVGSFVSILKQVAESRLPTVYNYHKTPAPFVQVKLLKILGLLGVSDKGASESMYAVLGDVLRKGDTGSTIGNAILYECICTITAIYPSAKLLHTCAEITSRFLKMSYGGHPRKTFEARADDCCCYCWALGGLGWTELYWAWLPQSDSHNLKYMGIDALGRVVKINADYANEHQLAVIDCLEDPDDTLKRKTLDLLYKMTKPANVGVIVERMIAYMRTVTDAHGKVEIASRIIESAERFAPSTHWFIQTMNAVFELAGDLVKPKVAHDLMRLIAEGSGDDDDADNDISSRSSAVESYLKLLEEPKLPSVLLQVICWVLGEYGTADGRHTAEDIVARLCEVAESHSEDDVVRARALVDELCASPSTDLQQRAYELLSLLGLSPDTVAAVLPPDASCEDIEVDKELSFLDAFVADALAKGAKPYVPEEERLSGGAAGGLLPGLASDGAGPGGDAAPAERSLRFEAYDAPSLPAARPPAAVQRPAHPYHVEELQPGGSRLDGVFPYGGGGAAPELSTSGQEGARLRLDGVQKKWGKPTYAPASSSVAAAASAAGASGGSSSALAAAAPSSSSGDAGQFSAAAEAPYKFVDKRKQAAVAQVSAEKQRLAASLFGGGGGGGSGAGGGAVSLGDEDNVTTGGRAGLSHGGRAGRPGAGRSHAARPGSAAAAAAAAPAPAPPPDLLDLLDMDDSPSSGAPAAASAAAIPGPAVDPFQELEGLQYAPAGPANGSSSSSSSLPSSVPAEVPQGDFLSHYNDMGVPGTHRASSLLGELGTGSLLQEDTAAAAAKLGASAGKEALLRDAVSRQAGVITRSGGANPVLFKDIAR